MKYLLGIGLGSIATSMLSKTSGQTVEGETFNLDDFFSSARVTRDVIVEEHMAAYEAAEEEIR